LAMHSIKPKLQSKSTLLLRPIISTELSLDKVHMGSIVIVAKLVMLSYILLWISLVKILGI